MKVDIYIREVNGNREIRIPWLPDEISFGTGDAIMGSYDIINRGEVAVPAGVGLSEYSWESIFPGAGRQYTDYGLMRGEWKEPAHYHNILTSWKEKGTKLNLTVIGYPINIEVYLTEYTGIGSGGFGDITYTVGFKEARSITITTSKQAVAPKKRPVEKKMTVVVKEGDTLWTLAEKHLGAGSKWRIIYDLNCDIIEKTAIEHRRAANDKNYWRGSNGGHWIFPGTVLILYKVTEEEYE